MRLLVVLGTVLFLNFTYSQNINLDSTEVFSIFQNKMRSLQDKGVKQSILIFNSSGKIVLVWKKNNRFKAIKSFYKGNKMKKIKSHSLKKVDFKNISHILQNPSIINKLYALNCNDDAYTYSKIWVMLNFENTYHSFYSKCEQSDELGPLIALYFSIFKE